MSARCITQKYSIIMSDDRNYPHTISVHVHTRKISTYLIRSMLMSFKICSLMPQMKGNFFLANEQTSWIESLKSICKDIEIVLQACCHQ
jgi:hypothetical protein